MKLSHLSETLIGSEIVKLGGEIKEKIRQGHKIYNFTIGDFDPAIFPIPQQLEDDIVEAYRQHLTNYPLAEGNLDLRESIAAFTKQTAGLEYGLDEILVASGGRPLIYAVFRAVCDEDDSILYAVPSWNNNHYTHFVKGKHIVVEAGEANKFMPTAADIAPHIQEISLLALCSPQNPTGTTFRKEELAAICDLVIAENNRRGADEKKLYLLYDQMYGQLTYGDIQHHDPVSLRSEMKPYTIYIDAISKVFAATGVRVGWGLGPAKVIAKMKAILTHIGAWAPMAEQKATAKFLKNQPAIDTFLQHFKTETEYRLRTIYDGFMAMQQKGLPVTAIAPEAAIYLTVKIDLAGKTTEEGTVLQTQADVTSYILDEAKIALVPFSAFGADKTSAWYRLSIGTCKREEIPAMLQSLQSAVEKLK